MQATTENQDSVATKDSTMKQGISFTAGKFGTKNFSHVFMGI